MGGHFWGDMHLSISSMCYCILKRYSRNECVVKNHKILLVFQQERCNILTSWRFAENWVSGQGEKFYTRLIQLFSAFIRPTFENLGPQFKLIVARKVIDVKLNVTRQFIAIFLTCCKQLCKSRHNFLPSVPSSTCLWFPRAGKNKTEQQHRIIMTRERHYFIHRQRFKFFAWHQKIVPWKLTEFCRIMLSHSHTYVS